MALAFSVTAFAQESKAYLSLSVGASLPGGDFADEAELGTGLDLGLGLGYRLRNNGVLRLHLEMLRVHLTMVLVRLPFFAPVIWP